MNADEIIVQARINTDFWDKGIDLFVKEALRLQAEQHKKDKEQIFKELDNNAECEYENIKNKWCGE